MRKRISILFVAVLSVIIMSAADESSFFIIHVVDQETGRGVPLVELKTTNEMRFYTDSNGIVVFC